MPKGRRPETYGVDEYVPDGMVAQLLHPFRGMGNPLDRLGHPVESAKAIGRLTRSVGRGVKRSTLRPTHRLR